MENIRGSVLMVLAMAFFAAEDGFFKKLAETIPTGQVLIMMCLIGGMIFWGWLMLRGERLWTRELLHPILLLRNFGELLGAVGYILAITLTPLSTASAILQAIPLAVALGAALFLGEDVGWRRWSAILLGLVGVVMIIRPGTEGFDANALFGVLGVIGLTIRDLCTRRMPVWIPAAQISASAYFVMVLAGIGMLVVQGKPWQPVDLYQGGILMGAVILGVLGYTAIVAATRIGDASVVAPFRYARLVFGMIVGITVFGERPDMMTYLGSAVIVIAGIYAFWRETQRKRGSNPA